MLTCPLYCSLDSQCGWTDEKNSFDESFSRWSISRFRTFQYGDATCVFWGGLRRCYFAGEDVVSINPVPSAWPLGLATGETA